MGRGGGKSPLLLPMLQRFLVSVLYRPLFNLTCGVISWQFSNFEALVIVHSCNLSPPRRLFEWGGPPNPPTPAPGVDVTSSNGGTPQTPPLPRQGWMSPPRMGGTPQTPPLPRPPRYAKTLYAHPRYAKTLHSPCRMAIFDTSVPSLCSGTDNPCINEKVINLIIRAAIAAV